MDPVQKLGPRCHFAGGADLTHCGQPLSETVAVSGKKFLDFGVLDGIQDACDGHRTAWAVGNCADGLIWKFVWKPFFFPVAF